MPFSNDNSDPDRHQKKRHLLIQIKREEDILAGGQEIVNICKNMGFSSLDCIQIRTAFSQLSRNMLKFAKEGEVILRDTGNEAVTILFIDNGPGIADVEKALSFGYSTVGSRGLGLPCSKKLADRLQIFSEEGKGTHIKFIKYKNKYARMKSQELIPTNARKVEKKRVDCAPMWRMRKENHLE